MLRSTIVAIVTRCTRRAWLVIALSTVLGVISGVYAVQHFAINTDINKLISPDLAWRKRDLAFEKAFPHHLHSILAVVDAPTPELASQAASALVERLAANKEQILKITQPGGGEFFRRNGLLFLPTEEAEKVAKQLTQAEPLIAQLATDASLRGLVEVLQMGLTGVELEKITLDSMVRPLTVTAETVEAVQAGKTANFSWHELLNPSKPDDPVNSKRKFIDIQPKLDFTALEPGHAATAAIRKAAEDLKLATDYGARLRLTGPVRIADEEFATVQEGMVVNGIATIVIVLVILWLALKSGKIILAVFLNLLVGLALTAALGFLVVGPLNLISIAFAVLFVGLGVDFGIQFSVRYRADRYDVDDLRLSLAHAARHAGAPLTLAAAAVAAGFLSFLPTDYRGVSELGQIAGIGMIVAYLTSITLLPALLTVLNPPGEPEPLGFAFLAPVDRFMERHRVAIIAGTAIVSLGGLPLLYYLQFDFNPINLRNPHVESIATFLDLRKDPATGASSINVMVPSLEQAAPVAERLAKVPEVSRVTTLELLRAAGPGAQARRDRGRARQARALVQAGGGATAADRRGERHRAQRGGDGAERGRREARNRPGRAGRKASRLRSGQARQGDAADASAGRKRLHAAAQDRARRPEGPDAGASGEARRASARHRRAVEDARWPRARRGAAEGRSERQRDAARFRARGARGAA